MNMSIDTLSHVANLRSQASQNDQFLLLDLFCGAGGASKGYMNAGYFVVGMDVSPQPNYIGNYFIQMDALNCTYEFLELFDVIHASPPCQQYSVASAVARKQGKVYPDLIHPTRCLLIASGLPYIMENVPPAPLSPDICLDGSMFNLGVIRKRIFEINIMGIPVYPKASKIDGSVLEGDYVTVAGKGNGGIGTRKRDWQIAMGIDWMSKKELAESIPPAYTEWIGSEVMNRISENNLKSIPASNPRKLPVKKLYPIQKPLLDLQQFETKAGAI